MVERIRKAEAGPLTEVAQASDVEGTLSNVFYVDQGTSTPLAEQDGSILKPWSTLLAAMTARAAAGGTFRVVPADYSAETIPSLDASLGWSFIGLDFGQFLPGAAGDLPNGPETVLPNLTLDAGLSDGRCELRSVRIENFSFNAPGLVALTDVVFSNGCFAASPGDAPTIKASRCYFNGGGVGSCILFDGDRCGFFGSQSIVCTGDTMRLTRCYGETSLYFSGPAGTAYVDLFTRGQCSFLVITNGARVVAGFGPNSALPEGIATQSITGVSPQDQIDAIVAAGVVLGLWTDDR